MKGLELSRALFEEQVRPRLESDTPELLPYLAAGLAGEGSECFGYDDEQSRDHDWGAGLCLWLTDDAPETASGKLSALLASLPERFRGVPVRLNAPGRTGVFTVSDFYRRLLGRPDAPETAEDWLALAEPSLAAATNGAVFYDGAGQFSAVRRRLLAHYPADVRRYLLARCAALAGQTGQYNYARCMLRGDAAAAQVIRGRFLENAAAMAFLLCRRYRPFYKWTFRALAALPEPGAALAEKAAQLAEVPDGPEAAAIFEEMAAALLAALRREGLTEGKSDFLMDHVGELLRGVQDEKLREKGVSLVF